MKKKLIVLAVALAAVTAGASLAPSQAHAAHGHTKPNAYGN